MDRLSKSEKKVIKRLKKQEMHKVNEQWRIMIRKQIRYESNPEFYADKLKELEKLKQILLQTSYEINLM